MIARTLDRLTAAHPAFAEYVKNHIYSAFDTTAGRNIAVCLISGLAAGLFAGGWNAAARYISLAVMTIVWAQAAMLSGFLKQWLYIAFAAVYMMLPYVFIIHPDTVEAAQADELQFMLSDLMQAVPIRPMRLIAGEGDPFTVSAAMLAAYGVLFVVGVRLRSYAKRSDFYCRTRLDQLR